MSTRRRRKSNNTLPIMIGLGMLFAGLMMTLGLVAVLALALAAPERIAARVAVAGIDIGGRTVEDASVYLQQQLANRTLVATDGGRNWTLALSDLGIGIDVDSTIAEASSAARGAIIQPRYIVDLNQTQIALVTLSEQVNIAAVPGNPPQYGRAIDIPVVLDRLRVNVTGELADGILDLTMIDVEPPPLEPEQPAYEGPTSTHIVERGQELGLIARAYNVSVQDIVTLNGIEDANLIYPGQELIIPAAGVFTPDTASAPPAPTSSGRSLLVDISDQRIYAYENGALVRSHLVSTGLPQTPTVLGDYNIYVKFVADDMQGDDYFLPQVPYVMYFYQGYGIHGTYWHNSFGRPMSHGCVNLPVDEAEWFFNFASVGMLVRVVA
ncbi:MAG: L,D-transpeptidase family protein [Chloroflexi bacterium]|nr:L,D-transpeptidase family protein [Chloroflexota bacterium]